MRDSDPSQNRLECLDGLRGIAILLVVIWHYFIDLPVTGSPLQVFAVVLLSWTWAGVDLFFVLSGFLIARNLLLAPSTRDHVTAFYVRRLARLAPLYIVVLFGFIVARSLYADINSANAARLFGRGVDLSFEYQLFLQNITMAARGIWPGQWLAPTWSLAVEVQFYLVAPIIMLMTPRSRLPPVLLSIAAAALALRCIIVGSTGSTMAAHLLLPCRADTFMAGALVAVLSLDRRYQDLLAKIAAVTRRYSWGIVLTLLSSSTFGFVLYAPQTATVGYSILAVLASALLVGALYSTAGAWNTVLKHPALRFFGTHSFGIYLLHQPVRGLLAIALADEGYTAATSPVLSLLAIGVTMGLAAASWRYFEEPFVNMSRRFRHTDSTAAIRAP